MLLTGMLVAAAGLLLFRRYGHRAAVWSTVLLGAGIFLVGVFPGNTAPHQYVSLFTFTAGGIAALVSARVVRGPLRSVSTVLGTIALAALVLGTFLIDWAPVAALGLGGIERWVAYPVVLWMVAFGGYLTAGVPSALRAAGRQTGNVGRMRDAVQHSGVGVFRGSGREDQPQPSRAAR
jgi:hypothetical membrane protein